MNSETIEFRECEDCHDEAVWLHFYQTVEFAFCDQHSMRELRRDLALAKNRPIDDFIEAVWLP